MDQTVVSPVLSERKKLPDERYSITHKFSVAGHEGYLTVSLYPDTMQPGEIFIRMSKMGSTLNGLLSIIALQFSLLLQYGVPLSELIRKMKGVRFEPSGFTPNPDIKEADSIVDYIARWMEKRFQNGNIPSSKNGSSHPSTLDLETILAMIEER